MHAYNNYNALTYTNITITDYIEFPSNTFGEVGCMSRV